MICGEIQGGPGGNSPKLQWLANVKVAVMLEGWGAREVCVAMTQFNELCIVGGLAPSGALLPTANPIRRPAAASLPSRPNRGPPGWCPTASRAEKLRLATRLAWRGGCRRHQVGPRLRFKVGIAVRRWSSHIRAAKQRGLRCGRTPCCSHVSAAGASGAARQGVMWGPTARRAGARGQRESPRLGRGTDSFGHQIGQTQDRPTACRTTQPAER